MPGISFEKTKQKLIWRQKQTKFLLHRMHLLLQIVNSTICANYDMSAKKTGYFSVLKWHKSKLFETEPQKNLYIPFETSFIVGTRVSMFYMMILRTLSHEHILI